MFNIGAAELILLLLIAFVVVGPKDLPKIAAALGRFIRYIRNMIQEVKRETGFDEVAEDLRSVQRDLKGVGDDLQRELRAADIRPDLQKTEREIKQELGQIKKDINLNDNTK